MDIVCFEQSECSQIAAASAVRPSIREKNIEAVSQQQLGITGHSEAVVGESVQQDHSIPLLSCGRMLQARRVQTPGAGLATSVNTERYWRAISLVAHSSPVEKAFRLGCSVASAMNTPATGKSVKNPRTTMTINRRNDGVPIAVLYAIAG
jgi:hypothetical protein